jgi:predicted ATPase/class 3 adenylate cyclase
MLSAILNSVTSMHCPSCGFENPAGMKFCGACAAPLKSICANCGFENPPGFKFCGQCGASLNGATPATAVPEHKTPEAERRHLTVMFCDLVGSTSLAHQLDPEELREVVRQYQKVCAEAINRFEGNIAQYLGDGILAYFGYPRAHEDEARRAVRAGLEILDNMQQLNARLQREIGVNLAVRVGIHTGLVVVGEMGTPQKREQLALGKTPNLAARLQGLADPNTVVISAATHRLVQGFFSCQSLGPHKLKGIPLPLEVFQVLHEMEAQSRFEATLTQGLTPLIGKQKEVEMLLQHWQHTQKGRLHLTLLKGEAGIGKSRLLRAFKDRLGEAPHLWLESQCLPYHQNSALYPIIDLLQRLLTFRREESCESKTAKLETLLAQYDFLVAEAMPLFSELLCVPLGECQVGPRLNPQRQKQKTLEAVLQLLLKMAQQQPVVFVMEDLHWADASTLELLDLLISQQPAAPLFALLITRPEFSPAWENRPEINRLSLNRLTPEQIEIMVGQITGGRTLPEPVLRQIVMKTDGVPLFIEELTKMVLESGLLREVSDHYELSGPLPPLAIPATLQDSLMARLDRLAPVKEIAQVGAAIGREFSYELIQAVTNLPEDTLQDGLAQLVDAELLYPKNLPANGTIYVFKHALIQDTAYESLLKSTRQQYHLRIAEMLKDRFTETILTQPELLAQHYTEAGIKETAVVYWEMAGRRAIEHSANVEAINHLNKGLELLRTFPENSQRHERELELLTYLGVAQTAIKGYSDPEVEKIYTRARELCQHVERTPRLSSAMLGLWKAAFIRSDLQQAHELAQECMRLTANKKDSELRLTAHIMLGVALLYQGEIITAYQYLTEAVRLYNPAEHRSDAFDYGEDPGVVGLVYLAFTAWMLGYPEKALKHSNAALALAEKLDHPFTLALALNLTAWINELRQEIHIVLKRGEALIALAEEQDFSFWRACGFVQKGSALFELGQQEEGIALVNKGMTALHASGAMIGHAGGLAQRALAYGKIGRVEEGLQMVEEAIAVIKKGAERQLEAENYRIKGELLLMQTPPHEQKAEACFTHALEVARRQQAKSWELRIATSLGRFWIKQGKRAEARALLAEAYNWFTEGFDTADLRKAKALLEESAD